MHLIHPRFVAYNSVGPYQISTILMSTGDCFETIAVTRTGREKYLHQTTDRAKALENHAAACEMCRVGLLPEKAIYVSFVKSNPQ